LRGLGPHLRDELVGIARDLRYRRSLASAYLTVADTKEAMMADYATLLRGHVTLTCRSVDRVFLQAYVPKLQSVGGVCRSSRIKQYFKEHRALRTETVVCLRHPRLRHRPAGDRRELESPSGGWQAANQRLCDAPAADARPAPDVATFAEVTRPSRNDSQHAPALPFGTSG
jgi:hypothetical protein